MRVYELFESDFKDDDPLRVATTAALAQIKADIDDSAYKGKFTVKALLEKLQDNGVNITHAQLLDLIKEEPWSNMIASLKGDGVVFKGDPDQHTDSTAPDETSKTMDTMAKRAAKKSGK